MDTVVVNGETYVKSSQKYERQVNTVCAMLGETFLLGLKEHNAIIAGGAVLSAFTNKEIHDIDVYFRSFEDMKACFFAVTNNFTEIYLSHTDKSITLCDKETKTLVQFIHFDYFDTPKQIFDCFDFTVCMGAIEVLTDSVVLHEDFLTDIATKTMRFNPGTRFPYISLLRTKKYREYGYSIGKGQSLAIATACSRLPINDWETAKDQLGGVYGHEIELQVEKETEFTDEAFYKILTDITETRIFNPKGDYEALVKKLKGEDQPTEEELPDIDL